MRFAGGLPALEQVCQWAAGGHLAGLAGLAVLGEGLVGLGEEVEVVAAAFCVCRI